jgi:hypothetical protein
MISIVSSSASVRLSAGSFFAVVSATSYPGYPDAQARPSFSVPGVVATIAALTFSIPRLLRHSNLGRTLGS